MKILTITIALMVSVVTAWAASTKWDFEDGEKGGWIGWGTEEYEKVIEIVTQNPHGGAYCLKVVDDQDKTNPYAGMKMKIDPRKAYSLSGWVRGEKKIPSCRCVAVASETKDGKFIKWLTNAEKIDIDKEWKPFSITIKDIPAEAAFILLALAPTRDTPYETRGSMWFDDISFDELTLTAVDLSKAANMGFKDEVAGDGKGGWTDQGIQDMRNFVPGDRYISNIPFKIIDPALNQGNSIITLGNRGGFAGSRKVTVNQKADWIYLLHTAARAGKGILAGYFEYVYADGSTSTVNIFTGDQLSDWSGGAAVNSHAFAVEKPNEKMSKAYLYTSAIRNPFPEKNVSSIVFRATDAADSQALWIILAATLGCGPELVEKSQWIADTLLVKGSEMESLGLISDSTLPASTIPLRLTSGDSLCVETSINARLHKSVKEVAGVSFHRIGGYGTGKYSMPYDRNTGDYAYSPELEKAVRELNLPMTRFYAVGCESFGINGAIDRIAILLDKLKIPQNTSALELETIGASEKLDPAVWASAAAYSVSKGYRFNRWEIGNEVDQAEKKKAYDAPDKYVAQVKAVSAAVRKEQPGALIGLSVNPDKALWGNYVLKAAAGHYDFVVCHWYEFREVKDNFEESIIGCNNVKLNQILRMNALIKAYNPTRNVRQYDTEWARHVYPQKRSELVSHRPNGNILGSIYQAVRLIYYAREDVLDGASAWCLNSLSTHYQSMGFVGVNDAQARTLSMNYWLFYYFNRHFGEWVLDIKGTAPCIESVIPENKGAKLPLTPILITASDDGSKVFIVAANASWTKDFPCSITINSFDIGNAGGVLLSNGDLNASMWLKEKSDFVHPFNVKTSGNNVSFEIPRHSIVFINLEGNNSKRKLNTGL